MPQFQLPLSLLIKMLSLHWFIFCVSKGNVWCNESNANESFDFL